jgi:hypothetical protein
MLAQVVPAAERSATGSGEGRLRVEPCGSIVVSRTAAEGPQRVDTVEKPDAPGF